MGTPELAGGTGSIVFRSKNGNALTAGQPYAIGSSLDELAGQSEVTEVAKPFELQESLDDAQTQLHEGQATFDKAAKDLEEGKKQLPEGEAAIKEARAEIRAGREQLDTAEKKLADGQAQLKAGEATLEASTREPAAGAATLTSGQEELAAAPKESEEGNSTYQAGAKQVADGRKALDTGQAELDANSKKIAAGRAEHEAGMKKILNGQSRADAEKELAQDKDEAGAGLSDAETGLKDINASISTTNRDLAQAKATPDRLIALPKDQQDVEAIATLEARISAMEAALEGVQGGASAPGLYAQREAVLQSKSRSKPGWSRSPKPRRG